MQKVVDRYLATFIILAGILCTVAVIILKFFFPDGVTLFLLAYLISFIFVASNFLMVRKLGVKDNSTFFKIFGWSLALRFVGVIAAVIYVLFMIKNYQIFFTVSFIISYICHSIMEIIFINRILGTDT